VTERAPSDRLLEFLVAFANDRAEGRERPLTEYLTRFPGADAQIAAAYAEACGVEAPQESDASDMLGPYRLLRELGRGGQAVVWLAEDTRFGREVALKVAPRPPGAEDLAPRLRREAQAASRVSHPGLCPIYDVGADERQAWIAMRYVAGETLERRIARRAADPLEQRLDWLERVSLALHEAHEAGVVHRDVKPGNIMLEPTGQPVLLDFGIARGDELVQLTLTGDALGTPAYMAPEVLRGERCDRRADVWSLGVSAFELVTGARPFEAPTRELVVRAILDEPAPDARALAPQLPRELAVVLATALEKDPQRRYQSARDFAEELARVRRREPIRARPASATLKLRRWAERNRKLAASLATLALVLVAALVTTSLLLSRTREALARRDALVRDVGQLSDQTLAADLLAQAGTLWPANPERVPALEAWLASTAEVLAHRARHVDARVGLKGRTDLDPDALKNQAARAWLVAQLDRLLETLDQLAELQPSVEQRLVFARELRARSVESQADAWRAAAERVRADARFAGFELRPQVGLVPLGADPRSQLEEFAHLASGAASARDEHGELELDGASGVVLVLLPPGDFTLGCERPNETRPVGSANVDPWCGEWDGPLQRVTLAPCLIAKHELTRAQFLRQAGFDPSALNADAASQAQRGRFPVETVSWELATRVLNELDLQLPTEAQWEYAARAGTTSVFFTGDTFESLQGSANVADATAARGGANWPNELGLDDGFMGPAPVGSFAPNAFGLHDVHGNVMEWCRDTWEDLALVAPRAGDGLFEGREPTRVQRGGSFSHNPANCRSAARNGTLPSYVAPMWGVRAARRVD
jgi:serine/threonine protein kinase/formylglycine-generating enzyme required for sulfatase activity